jgi:hypothetical protein
VNFLCIDCGVDTYPLECRDARTSEYYMVHDAIWLAAGMSTKYGGGFLCIGCLEARLGRTLTPCDFTDAPINRPDRWHSPRLNARLVEASPDLITATQERHGDETVALKVTTLSKAM